MTNNEEFFLPKISLKDTDDDKIKDFWTKIINFITKNYWNDIVDDNFVYKWQIANFSYNIIKKNDILDKDKEENVIKILKKEINNVIKKDVNINFYIHEWYTDNKKAFSNSGAIYKNRQHIYFRWQGLTIKEELDLYKKLWTLFSLRTTFGIYFKYYPIANIYLYSKTFSYFKTLYEKIKFKDSLQLNNLLKHIWYYWFFKYWNDYIFNVKKDNIFLWEKWWLRSNIKSINIEEDKVKVELDFEQLSEFAKPKLSEHFFQIIWTWYFWKEWALEIQWANKSWKKEYAKVYQQNNFKQGTEWLVSNVIEVTNAINLKDVQWVNTNVLNFLNSLKGVELDRTTEIVDMNNFFNIFIDILKYINTSIFVQSKVSLKKVLKWTFFKIRKLWQMKAHWIYYPYWNTLAVDPRWWTSICHELWHWVHYQLYKELYNDQNQDFINFKVSQELKILYAYTSLWSNILEIVNLYKKDNWKQKVYLKRFVDWLNNLLWENTEVYSNLLLSIWDQYYNKVHPAFPSKKLKDYIWNPKEVLARLFDILLSKQLSNNNPLFKNIINKNSESALYSLDYIIIKIVTNNSSQKFEKLQNELFQYFANSNYVWNKKTT